jgi:hypothetical protein
MLSPVQAKVLYNALALMIGFAAGFIERWYLNRLIPKRRRFLAQSVKAIVRATIGLVYILSVAFLAVTLDPIWLVPMALFSVGAYLGARTCRWYIKR